MSEETPAEWAEDRYDQVAEARRRALDAAETQRTTSSTEQHRRAARAESIALARLRDLGGTR